VRNGFVPALRRQAPDCPANGIDIVRGMIERFANLRTGLRLHYAEYGNPDGEPVVFLHGWPDSWFSFSRVMPLLPESIRAVAVDQRGFGDSDRPESGYAIPEMGTDLIAFLDALGIKRATLVGHSFGSFIARQVAIAQPQRVAERLARSARSGPGGVRARFPGKYRVPPPSARVLRAAHRREPEAATTPLAPGHRSPSRVRRHAANHANRGPHAPIVGR